MSAIDTLKKITQNWGLLALTIVLTMIILYSANSSHKNFEATIVENFNNHQSVLANALSKLVIDHAYEAGQSLLLTADMIISNGNPDKSLNAMSLTYHRHEDDFIAIGLLDDEWKLVSQVAKDPANKSVVSMLEAIPVPKYNGQNDLFISERYLLDNRSVINLFIPITLADNKQYTLCGILRIEDFIKHYYSIWEGTDVTIVLTNNDGYVLSVMNMEHESANIMGMGNITSLDTNCVPCHKQNDFLAISKTIKNHQISHSIYKDPNNNLKNRTSLTFPIFDEFWSISLFSPYDHIQGAIEENAYNNIIFSLLTILIIGSVVFISLRAQKKRAVLEAETANLLKIAETAEALRDSEEKFRTLFEDSLDAVYLTTRDGKFIDLNQAALIFFDYTREEIMHMNLQELFADARYIKIFQQKIEKRGFVKNYEVQLRKKTGMVMDCLVTSKARKNREGNIIGYHGIIRDITKRKRVEEKLRKAANLDKKRMEEIQESYEALRQSQNAAINLMEDLTVEIAEREQVEKSLRESEEKFRRVIQQSNDGIYVLQGNRFVFINPRFTELTGYILEEISSKDFNFRELVAEESMKVIAEREAMYNRGETLPGRYIFKCLRKDGRKRDFEVSVTTVDWDGDPATLGILHDVTERLRTEKELEQALEKAQQGERVKSLFLANMSHEIRTPLNAILGFTDLLEQNVRELVGREELTFFDSIKDSGERLMRTVHEVLDISQVEAGTLEVNPDLLDLVKIVERLVSEFKNLAQNKGLKLNFSSSVLKGIIKADKYCIEQALANIMDNAVKYTEKGEIDISLIAEDTRLILAVKDTGIGISTAYLEQIFEVFSQESMGYTKKFQGVGLGLALTKRYLDLCKVKIDIHSKKGIGSNFILTFNQVKEISPVNRKELEPETFVKLPIKVEKGPLILVVDDDVNSRNLISFYLKKDYSTCFAISVSEAKQKLKSEAIALILLDLSLVGDEDGLDLARHLRKTKKWKNIPIIATTAHAFETDRKNCLTAGCTDYLSKPLKQKVLLEKIEQYLS